MAIKDLLDKRIGQSNAFWIHVTEANKNSSGLRSQKWKSKEKRSKTSSPESAALVLFACSHGVVRCRRLVRLGNNLRSGTLAQYPPSTPSVPHTVILGRLTMTMDVGGRLQTSMSGSTQIALAQYGRYPQLYPITNGPKRATECKQE